MNVRSSTVNREYGKANAKMQPKKSNLVVCLSEEIIIFVGMKAKNKYGQYDTNN